MRDRRAELGLHGFNGAGFSPFPGPGLGNSSGVLYACVEVLLLLLLLRLRARVSRCLALSRRVSRNRSYRSCWAGLRRRGIFGTASATRAPKPAGSVRARRNLE